VKFGLSAVVVLASLWTPLPRTVQSAVAQEKPSAQDAPKTSGEATETVQPSSRVAKNGNKNEDGSAGGNLSPGKQGSSEQQDPGIYHIGIEDELQISVWKEPEISTTAVVRPDGMITLPLLNDVYVQGLQTAELQTLLTEKLKPFVNEPQVTIIVRGIKSRKVYVYGQVTKAGAYSLVGRKTVLEVLSEAGGLSLFAKKSSIYVLRNVDNKKTRLPFNYNNALKAKHPNDNFDLLPGDIVVVP
jgi:polysaccharide export outer membrane protein